MNIKGASLVELILVIATVGFIALLLANLPSSIQANLKSSHTSTANQIAAKQINNLRRVGFDSLQVGTESFTDSNLTSLPSASAQVEVTDCPAEVCKSDEDVKQVTVSVFWKESGDNEQSSRPSGTRKIELVTLVTEGGVAQ